MIPLGGWWYHSYFSPALVAKGRCCNHVVDAGLVKMRIKKNTVIIGLGNPFMSDDGIGVHIVERLAARAAEFPDVDFLNLGSASMNALHALVGRDRAFLLDCAYMGEPPGTMRRFIPEEVISMKPRTGLTIHESDMLSVLKLSHELGELPERTVIFAVQPAVVESGERLSLTLASRLEGYIRVIAAELNLSSPLS